MYLQTHVTEKMSVCPRITQVMLRNRIPCTAVRVPAVFSVLSNFFALLYTDRASKILAATSKEMNQKRSFKGKIEFTHIRVSIYTDPKIPNINTSWNLANRRLTDW